MPVGDFAHVQDDMNPHILRMPGGTFLHGETHIILIWGAKRISIILHPNDNTIQIRSILVYPESWNVNN